MSDRKLNYEDGLVEGLLEALSCAHLEAADQAFEFSDEKAEMVCCAVADRIRERIERLRRGSGEPLGLQKIKPQTVQETVHEEAGK